MRGLRDLLGDDRGAAVTAEFTLVAPLYLLVVCAAVEASLMLIAKCGVTYAAFAAARSASLHAAAGSPDPPGAAQRAAEVAMVPFASGEPGHNATPPGSQAARFASGLTSNLAPPLVAARFAYAQRATAAEAWLVPGGAGCRVRYRYPFRIPLFGRLFGEVAPWAPSPRVYVISAQAVVPTARSQTRLGIDYAPR
jgi:hypothetical protein